MVSAILPLIRINALCSACLMLLAFTGATHAYIEKGGNVSGETWAAGIYLVTSNLTVSDDTVLTVEAGAIIKFAGGKELDVYGTLDVNGVEGSPVVFTSLYDDTYGGDTNNDGNATSPSPGDWRGIYLHGEDDNDGIGDSNHRIIRYGGGGNLSSYPMSNLRFHESASGHSINSICEYSYRDGIIVNNSSPCFRRSRIENNNDCGIYIHWK